MSLANIKVKETKGKKNALPKLINILGDPYKRHCPVLKEDELVEFKEILHLAVKESGLAPHSFSKSKNIRVGLESSLRAINQKQTSCVLISLSLKPHHLVGLIARNVETKDSTVPVFAQPKLEELTEELFGVRSLILALPLQVHKISAALDQWVTNRKRKPQVKQQRIVQMKKTAKRLKVPAKIPKADDESDEIPDKSKQKSWSGDFISFGQEAHNVILFKDNEKDDSHKLTVALSVLSEQANRTSNELNNKMETDASFPVELPDLTETKIEPTVAPDCDDFIASEYKPLNVLHIAPNPNKIKKKKRNKKNKNKK